jgi:lipid-binding SYLF domain-containing protein
MNHHACENPMRNILTLLSLLLVIVACAAPGANPMQRRSNIESMAAETLQELYRHNPEARARVQKSEGYAVFTNKQVAVLLIGGGGGYGVARDQKNRTTTYMRMGEGNVGIGIGLKDFRAVFVFDNRELFDDFLANGWDVGGEADAAAKSGEEGAAASAAVSVRDGVTIYQFTENGLALRANIAGTRYWPYSSLNWE